MKADQPGFLVLTGGHVLQHPDHDLAEGGTTLAAAALGLLGPVEVVHLKVGFVLALGVAFGKAGTGFWAVAYPLAHDSPPLVRPLI